MGCSQYDLRSNYGPTSLQTQSWSKKPHRIPADFFDIADMVNEFDAVNSEEKYSNRLRELSNFLNLKLPVAELEIAVSAIIWLEAWSEARGIFSSSNCGFITSEMLFVMVSLCCVRLKDSNSSLSRLGLVRSFFRTFGNWRFNECSVAGDCCNLARVRGDPSHMNGSMIDENEQLDSDCDESSKTLSRAGETASDSSTVEHKHLSTTADENDEVHPHKRHRYDLGQIRDIRRFHEVDNEFVERVSLAPGGHKYPSSLDFLDAFSVMDPFNPEVNLAIRVLESHRKLIVQELVRADQLLCDSVGDDESFILSTDSEILKPANRFNCTAYLVFEISSDVEDIRKEVVKHIEEQTWFLIQEIQAFHGLMVTPFSQYIQKTPTVSQVVVGIDFVEDEPYWARDKVELDFSGPLSRTLLRARKALHKHDDFVSRFSKKFTVTAQLLPRDKFSK